MAKNRPTKNTIEKKPFDNKSFKTSLGLGEQTVKERKQRSVETKRRCLRF